MEQINFTPKEILKKEFKEKMRGYDPAEVDAFLDNVIRDYETFGKEIDQLEQENASLRQQLSQRPAAQYQPQQPVPNTPVQPVAQQPVAPAQPQPTPEEVTNAQILQRLNELENKVNGR